MPGWEELKSAEPDFISEYVATNTFLGPSYTSALESLKSGTATNKDALIRSLTQAAVSGFNSGYRSKVIEFYTTQTYVASAELTSILSDQQVLTSLAVLLDSATQPTHTGSGSAAPSGSASGSGSAAPSGSASGSGSASATGSESATGSKSTGESTLATKTSKTTKDSTETPEPTTADEAATSTHKSSTSSKNAAPTGAAGGLLAGVVAGVVGLVAVL